MSHKQAPLTRIRDANPGENRMKRTQLTLTSAQILTLGTVPVQLAPTPGPGKFIRVWQALFDAKFNTTPYSVPGGPALVVGQPLEAQAHSPVGNNISAAASNLDLVPGEETTDIRANFADQPITVRVETGLNPTLGDGTLTVIMYYTIEPLSP